VPLYKLAAAGGYPAAMANLGNMCIGTAAGPSPRTIRRLCAGIAKLRTQVTQKQCFSWGPSTNTGGPSANTRTEVWPRIPMRL
jgi:hypothetical protein